MDRNTTSLTNRVTEKMASAWNMLRPAGLNAPEYPAADLVSGLYATEDVSCYVVYESGFENDCGLGSGISR